MILNSEDYNIFTKGPYMTLPIIHSLSLPVEIEKRLKVTLHEEKPIKVGNHQAFFTNAHPVIFRHYHAENILLDYDMTQKLIDFYYHIKGGRAYFGLKDPFLSTIQGQQIGVGDGARRDFPLYVSVSGYDESNILPLSESIALYINGTMTHNYTLSEEYMISFEAPIDPQAVITADFDFDFKVRFLEEGLDITPQENLFQVSFQLGL